MKKQIIGMGILWGMLFFVSSLGAQSLPPLYANDPVELVPVRQVAQFPAYTFLESVAVDPEGAVYVASHEDGKIYRFSETGERQDVATLSGKIAGLVFTPQGDLLVTGWLDGKVPTLFQVNRSGELIHSITMEGAIFPNGITLLENNRYLIADSFLGAIWQFDVSTNSLSIWLEHEWLARRSPESQTPAVNGLKRFGNTLYVSNSDKAMLLKVPLQDDGSAGIPSVFVQGKVIDDFAFDTNGNLYGATHVFNSVVRVSPEGKVTVIAEADQGATGSTAVAFGRQAGDETGLYVVTNGGMFLPPATGVVPAEVFRLEVGTPGLSLPD